MKKSKHFRKDVIIARIIAGVLLIVLIALLVWVISSFTKPSGSDKDTQNTQSTQDVNHGNNNTENSEFVQDTENVQDTEDVQDTESEADVDNGSETDDQIYVKTTTQVRLRKEPNTDCATLDRIDGGTELLVLETLDGWYKVSHNGQEGYVSADYTEVVENE